MKRKQTDSKKPQNKVMAADANSQKVFDVTRPGKSPADATSRPIIGHKPKIKDPMMSEKELPLAPPHRLLDSFKKVTLRPTADADTAPKTTVEAQPDTSQPNSEVVTDTSPVSEPEPIANSADATTPPATAISNQNSALPHGDESADMTAEQLASLAMRSQTETAVPASQPVQRPEPTTPATAPDAHAIQQPISRPDSQPQPAQTPAPQQTPTSTEQPSTPQPKDSSADQSPPAANPAEPDAPTHGEIVVSTHNAHITSSKGVMTFWAAVFLVLIVIIFDALLDAGTLSLNIPHTHFL